jgi:hypothetical protein
MKKLPALYGIRMYSTVFTRALVPILRQMNPVYNFLFCFLKVTSNIILPHTPRSIKWFFLQPSVPKDCTHFYSFPWVIHAYPPHLSRFDPFNNIWRRAQNMKYQFSPDSVYFLPLRFAYSPQHPALRHPQSMLFP